MTTRRQNPGVVPTALLFAGVGAVGYMAWSVYSDAEEAKAKLRRAKRKIIDALPGDDTTYTEEQVCRHMMGIMQYEGLDFAESDLPACVAKAKEDPAAFQREAACIMRATTVAELEACGRRSA